MHETVIPGGVNCDPRRKTVLTSEGGRPACAARKAPTYGNLGRVLGSSPRKPTRSQLIRETVIPGGKTVIPDGRTVISGGTNYDPRRKLQPFGVIPDGTNCDLGRKQQALKPCKFGGFLWLSGVALLFVDLLFVLLTNKGE